MMHVIKWSCLAITLCAFQVVRADEAIDNSNCMQHIGGGGFGDFDCYENNAKLLEGDNQKIAAKIRQIQGVTRANRVELNRYMRAQDEVAKSCDLAVNLAYSWKLGASPKTHRDLYDVMTARCHYTLRKEQNDFLHDLYSIRID